jgi:hypothetical protein
VDLEGQIEAFVLGSLEEPNGGRRIRCYLRQAGDAVNHQQLVDKVRVACHEPGARRQPRQREFRTWVGGAERPQSWNRTQQVAETRQRPEHDDARLGAQRVGASHDLTRSPWVCGRYDVHLGGFALA